MTWTPLRRLASASLTTFRPAARHRVDDRGEAERSRRLQLGDGLVDVGERKSGLASTNPPPSMTRCSWA